LNDDIHYEFVFLYCIISLADTLPGLEGMRGWAGISKHASVMDAEPA
jgi:hypothetical protein